MVTTHQDANASPSGAQAGEQGLEKKSLPTISAGELESVVASLVKKALSNPATWPGGLPTTPVCSFGPSTPPLDADELEKQLLGAAETRGQSTDIDDGPSPGINEPCKARFKRVLEIWDKDTSKYKIVESIEPEVDDFSEYVFVIRDCIDPKSRKSTTYVDVKSETLRDILRGVLGNVKVVSAMEARPSIEQIVLFHFLPELKSKLNQLTDGGHSTGIPSPSLVVTSPADPDAYADCTTQGNLQHNVRSHPEGVEHLRLLVNHLDEAYAATAERLTPLLQRGEITYDLLELLFKPGCHVYTKCLGTGKSRCVVFDAAEETTQKDVTHLRLECHYLDHDDHEFGEVGIELGIVKFRGRKPIHTLEAFPLQYHPNRTQITQSLVERGRKFSQFIGRSSTKIPIQHCKGRAFIMKNGKPLALNINSRVAIDAALFREMMPNYRRPRVSDCWEEHSIFGGISLKEEEHREKLEKFKANGKDQNSITQDEYLICCPTVRCFSFSEKVFLECAVGDLVDVQWSTASSDHLQIPDDTKQILQSVTTSRLSSNQEVGFDDFIKGKGRGLNVLLFGPPGVGKTLTAEAMAEASRNPLYSVSAGELIAGQSNPLQLEMTLDRIFKIAKRLNTILLIDEADVFMENRVLHQGSHNRLVTVFLRKLEYYEGVLFLTTNRVTEFDEAILSRIHLKIKYPELTRDARRNVWKSFLAEVGTSQGPAIIKGVELERLASMKLNGREASHNTSTISGH
ncbi:ATP-binding protein [Aspergillus foveolatus]|uniref:ATP-binding protein n=1 Tax=Aspergillus foveolatus TaxID=210207 RepID=UPI003CCCBBE2